MNRKPHQTPRTTPSGSVRPLRCSPTTSRVGRILANWRSSWARSSIDSLYITAIWSECIFKNWRYGPNAFFPRRYLRRSSCVTTRSERYRSLSLASRLIFRHPVHNGHFSRDPNMLFHIGCRGAFVPRAVRAPSTQHVFYFDSR